jgi:anthranilate synthase component 1
MAAGIFGYMGYDTVRLIEDLPTDKPDPLALPDSILVRPTLIVIFDSVKDEMTVVTPVRPAPGVSAKAAYARTADRLNLVVERLDQPLPHIADQDLDAPHPEPKLATAPETYMEKVRRAKEYIAAGDVMQVVLSQRMKRPFESSPLSLYRALRSLNPSPYMFYYDFGDFHVVGASPEILVRKEGSAVTVRPIAGTRPRGATREADVALGEELLADPKEIAEHVMLVDLGRNDVGRVAQTGSVKVTERMQIERYSHVMHIVSNVEGTLKPGLTSIDVLRAAFPAGTLSGAPKIRAMQIISELEGTTRGPYGGCVGYFSFNGNLDCCITIRTALIRDGKAHVQAGGGWVNDSTPEGEFQETVNKAKGMLKAVAMAESFARNP